MTMQSTLEWWGVIDFISLVVSYFVRVVSIPHPCYRTLQKLRSVTHHLCAVDKYAARHEQFGRMRVL